MSLTPENSSTGWPSFGERFKSTWDSTHLWIKKGAQVKNASIESGRREPSEPRKFLALLAARRLSSAILPVRARSAFPAGIFVSCVSEFWGQIELSDPSS